jgi:hypothetical protein
MAPQVPVTDENDVMREQLEYLIEHKTRPGQCGCSECQRYLRVRAALLEIFGEPESAKIQKLGPQLVKAA